MKKLNLVIMSVMLACSISVFAKDEGKGHGKGHGPCREDVEKFCKDVKPGGGAIIRCLKEKEDQLSQSCKDHHAKMKEHRKDMKEACHADAEKLCSDQKGKERMKCMHENKDKLSEACKKEVSEMKEHRKAKH